MIPSRREFLEKSAALAALGFLPRTISAAEYERDVERLATPVGCAGRPCVVSSRNGIRGVKVAYDRIVAGTDTLDAIIAGVNIQELDQDDQSVGLGGLPNEEGVVQLDASCMHGPTKRAGSVGCLEEIATPSLVAKAVMDYTDHIMLVGHDALRFAKAMGFQTQNLLTEKSKQDRLKWKPNRKGHDYWLNDAKRDAWLRWSAVPGATKPTAATSTLDAERSWPPCTINSKDDPATGDIDTHN